MESSFCNFLLGTRKLLTAKGFKTYETPRKNKHNTFCFKTHLPENTMRYCLMTKHILEDDEEILNY